ncbi:MAG: hypothetical protein Q8L98_07995 [Chlamydiales bacterium]|nr:hypothetical protein [Chlamydiales bacterium]
MTFPPVNEISNSSEWEKFFLDEEDLRESTTKKSSQVAQAVFSSPSQNIEDWTLSHSFDFPDFLLSPSDIQLETESYYEQGPFSLEELFEESNRKRKGSPIEETPASKRICLSEQEGSQAPISVSNERGISSFLELSESEQKSIAQMDEFYQMVQTAEVLNPSREGWMGEFAQFPPDSHEEFIQQEWARKEETIGFQEMEEGLSLSENSKQQEAPCVEKQQTGSDKEKFLSEDQIVLDALQEDYSFGATKLSNKLKQRNIDIPLRKTRTILRRYGVETLQQREAAFKTDWVGVKTLFGKSAGYKRKARLHGELVSFRCSRLPEPEVSQTPISVSNEQQISSSLGPFEGEQKSISQLDGFGQMVDPFEVFSFSGEEGTSEFARPSLDSDTEFMQFIQEELAQPEEIVDLDEDETNGEIEKRLAFFDAPELIQQQAESSETGFDSEKPQIRDLNALDKERIILSAIYQDPSLGNEGLRNSFQSVGVSLLRKEVERVFVKYQLMKRPLREEASKAGGWLRSKILSSPLEPALQEIVDSLVAKPSKREKVLAVFSKTPTWGAINIANKLRKDGFKICCSSVYNILKKEGLETPEKREQAVKARQIQDQALSDSLAPSDSGFSSSDIVLEEETVFL